MIRKFFSPPVFQNEGENFRAKFINGFAWGVIALLSLVVALYLFQPGGDLTVIVLSSLIVVLLVSLLLLRRGNVTASGWLIVGLGWIGIGFQAFTADGVKDVIIVAYIAIGLLASIVISQRTGSVVIISSVVVIGLLAFREASGLFVAREQDPIIYGIGLGFIFIAITILIYFSTTSLREAITRATKSEESLLTSNTSLRELNQTLEERVATRTTELEQANRQYESRARQFEAITQVTRATAANQPLDNVLELLARVISEKFGFYHAGIFLLDENREFADLRAASSDGGRRMIYRNHRLRIGQTGIVGYVAATGEPRFALDVEADAAYFNNPDLPDTRSEMALPLRASGELIGVLDIQSVESKAFAEEDIEVLSILADLVATAIQNSRYFENTRQLVEQAQLSSGSYLSNSWQALNSQDTRLGYIASENGLKPYDQPLEATTLAKMASSNLPIIENGDNPSLSFPISLAGNVVGVVKINQQQEHDWETDEIDIAKAVADRLSLALEAATLLTATQKRAEIERLTADITGKIGSTTQFDSILRTAAEELSRVLGGSDVLVQIQSESVEASAEAEQPKA